MLVARVEGNAIATVKHSSMVGAKLLVVSPLRSMTIEPVLAVDQLGAREGDHVLISSDGKGVQQILQSTNTPARWAVIGIIDDLPKAWPQGDDDK